MQDSKFTRRRFIRDLAVAAPAGAVIMQSVQAQDLPKITEDDPAAKALIYVHDVADVDTSNPLAARFEPGQDCSNCVQIQGEEGADWRPCAIFPGKLVANKGWCSVWAPMP